MKTRRRPSNQAPPSDHLMAEARGVHPARVVVRHPAERPPHAFDGAGEIGAREPDIAQAFVGPSRHLSREPTGGPGAQPEVGALQEPLQPAAGAMAEAAEAPGQRRCAGIFAERARKHGTPPATDVATLPPATQ